MKFKTVREGEQAVLFNYLGEGTLINFTFMDYFEMVASDSHLSG